MHRFQWGRNIQSSVLWESWTEFSWSLDSPTSVGIRSTAPRRTDTWLSGLEQKYVGSNQDINKAREWKKQPRRWQKKKTELNKPSGRLISLFTGFYLTRLVQLRVKKNQKPNEEMYKERTWINREILQAETNRAKEQGETRTSQFAGRLKGVK